jgi:predicted secreted protein
VNTSFALAIYFVVWWVVLFAILPLRIGPQPEAGTKDPFAEASGAPLAPNMLRKFLVTTIVAGVIFAVIYAVLTYHLITLDDIPFLKI